jgi:ABC-type glycerol-3-phosphate transport system permease component
MATATVFRRVSARRTIPVAIVFFVFQKYILRTGEGAVKE